VSLINQALQPITGARGGKGVKLYRAKAN